MKNLWLTSCSLLVLACGSSGGESVDGTDGGVNNDAGLVNSCGREVCSDLQMCVDFTCVAQCESVESLCGAESELCCTGETTCIANQCVVLGNACEFTEECLIDEVCDAIAGRCVTSDVITTCEYIPPPGVFEPNLDCQWRPPAGAFSSYDDVVMTPSVANLSDDNEDGVTDANDIPDIAFISFDYQADGCCTTKGVIRVASGACNLDGSMTTIATVGGGDPFVDNSSGIALGNLHGDNAPSERPPEIVATMRTGAVAYTRVTDDASTWVELWRNETAPSNAHTRGGAQPAIADLDADGFPEVIIGNVVLNGLTGEVIWDGLTSVGAGAGVGNNAFLGPVSTVADIDLDGKAEVLAGNTAYRHDGTEMWSYTYLGDNSECQGNLPCDGFTAAGNFDDDKEGEVVIVRRGEVFVLEHDGTLKHRVPIPVDNCSRNESGPPTIADFDGDGRAEIGTAGADFYVVVDFDCVAPNLAGCDSENILWKVPNQDCSSRATGSSVFDFDGDGNAEVVYADETSFRIFAGADGTVLYNDTTHTSNTRMEMPIVVDVDNDGKSEIIVPEPNRSSTSLGGIEIIADTENNWVRTRRIWNQHGYSVTNVTEDGQIPRQPDINWNNGRLNNYRQNVQPAGLFNAPDLEVEVVPDGCAGVPPSVSLVVRNEGALAVAPGINIFVQLFSETNVLLSSGIIPTTQAIGPGRSLTLQYADAAIASGVRIVASVDDDGMGGSQYNECDESNNLGEAEVTCTIVN